MDKNKRILWLINHTTLRECEVPLLVDFGYEVYTPKIFPEDEANRSASVDFTYDKTLSIPAKHIEALNTHNFYKQPLTTELKEIVNTYFGTVILAFFPPMMEAFINDFQGKILLRIFGLANNFTYSQIMQEAISRNTMKKMREISPRFWFAQAYPTLAEIEEPFLKNRAVTLPLGLPDKMLKHKDTWKGDINKIFFVCPRIASSPTYYGEIYKGFKKHFGDFPHLIAGAQPVKVNDPHVAGFQSREAYDECLARYAVMFYHSKELRHLHYHPLEAIIFGMPLIYMKGGMLEQLGGSNQPGACSTYEEAKLKIKRVLDGDQEFINEIRSNQAKILATFSAEYIKQEWEKNFINNVALAEIPAPTISIEDTFVEESIKTIGVFLPIPYYGGSLNGAKNFAKMLHLGSKANNEKIRIVFSCIANTYNIKEDFSDLLALGITVRETVWKTMPQNAVKYALALSGQAYEQQQLKHKIYQYPTDGLTDFNDCDFWLIVSDRTHHTLAPIKPYGMVIYDYIQRYIPEMFGSFIETTFHASARGAKFIFTTTPSTCEDVIQYVGIAPSKVHLAPMDFNPINTVCYNTALENDYFIWTTNAAYHKNHLRALDALDIYYNELGGALDVMITGVDTERLNWKNPVEDVAYIQRAKVFIEKNPALKAHLKVMGHLNTRQYMATLSSAKFLWHPALIDNGTFTVIEAAYCNVPALSSSYPQMQYINDRFQLNLSFCDANDAHNMAHKLKKMEENYSVLREKLPGQEFLKQFSVNNIASQFWLLFRSLL